MINEFKLIPGKYYKIWADKKTEFSIVTTDSKPHITIMEHNPEEFCVCGDCCKK